MDSAELEGLVRAAAARAPADVVAVYLYGSQARGDASSDSDVDIGLLFRSTPPATLHGTASTLAAQIERTVRKAVDVVVMNSAAADLVHRVLRDGVLILDRDRAARVQFEVQSRNEYFDLEPVRRRYRSVRA